MRVSTFLLLQIVFRRLGRRAKSYFIIIIIVDVDERRGGKKNRVKLCFSLLHFFMNENNTQNERGGREQKKGIYIYLMR